MQQILAFDAQFEHFLYTIREPWALSFFLHVTDLGNGFVIAALGLITIILLYRMERIRDMIGLITTLLCTAVSVEVVKILIQRPRPGGVMQVISDSSYSFPSGHAAASMAFYGFLMYLILKLTKSKPHYKIWRAVTITLGSLLILAIGFSRLYIGVHFPSDVIAGYLFGGVCLFIGILIAKRSHFRIAK